MALQITTNINVDFYDNQYVMINAKQYDDKSRLVSITCYNEGNLYNLSARSHTAYIKFRKANGRWVLNSCQINNRGQVLVELTEQMLAESGICYVDLFIVNKGSAIVNVDTGSIVTVDGSSVLTTKAFYIDVQEAVVDNSLIESDNEYKGLTDLMELAHAEYSDTILAAKSWAVGTNNQARENDEQDNSEYYSRMSKSWAIGSTGIRTGENANNSKYYSERSSDSADKSKSYAVGGTGTRTGEDIDNSKYYSLMSESFAMGGTGLAARTGEDTDNAEYYSRLSKSYAMGDFDGSTGTRDNESSDNAKTYMDTAKSHMDTTKSHMDTTESYMITVNGYMGTTQGYMNTTEGYMNTTESHMNNAKSYMDDAKSHMDNAESYMNNAKTSETNAASSESNASSSEANALSYMNNAKEYMDNAKTSETNAKTSETNALSYMDNAKTSETNAKTSENNAKVSETNSKTSETNAYDYSVVSQRYAVGGTNTEESEEVDNAKYYYQQVKGIDDSLEGVLHPKDTVAFEELATVEKFTGYLYVVENSFTTDDTFTDGAGISYPAGTLVYYTVDGKWSCFDGFSAGVATVDEVKSYLDI